MSILAYLLQIQYWFPSKDKKIYGFTLDQIKEFVDSISWAELDQIQLTTGE